MKHVQCMNKKKSDKQILFSVFLYDSFSLFYFTAKFAGVVALSILAALFGVLAIIVGSCGMVLNKKLFAVIAVLQLLSGRLFFVIPLLVFSQNEAYSVLCIRLINNL